MKPLGAAVAPEKALLELARGCAAARIGFAALLQPSLRKADDHSTKEAQCKGRFAIPNPAVIFAEGDVQSVVQAVFNGPIAAFEFEQTRGPQFFEGQTANEINDFSGFLAPAAHSSSEPGDGLNSGKAHLLRASVAAIQHSDFAPTPVLLPGHGMSLGRGLRGKSAVG